MAAAATDYFMKVGNPGTATTLASPGYEIDDDSIVVESTAEWPTDTGCIFAMDIVQTVNGEEKRVDNSLSVFAGVVSGAGTISDLDFLVGTPQKYDPGAQTRVYVLISSQHTNRLIDGILQFADQQGNLLKAAVQEALGLGTDDLSGWNPLAYTPSTVTHLGNRSYTMVFTGQDLRTVLSRGMRLRTTRATAAPDKCTSLNGTNQSWSKSSSITGMSFVDDFAAGVWLKLSGYPSGSGVIVSRYNGTSGWAVSVESDGTVKIAGYNAGSANISSCQSAQSLPIDRWVHVAAQLDMSAFTATPTTSYIMLDGLDVPASVARAGTSPTALIQAGNLEVGSSNGGANLFPGKIAQLGIFGSKVTQSTMTGYMNQALAGSESGLVSAYSFNGTANDLNANANNLSANGSAVATSTDSPFGGQDSGNISTMLDYGIVMDVSFSTNTTLTVQVPEGCTLPTSGTISAVAYAPSDTPYGFPKEKRKWDIYTYLRIDKSVNSPAANSWANVGSGMVNLPVGLWDMVASAWVYGSKVSSGNIEVRMTLSNANNTEVDRRYSAGAGVNPLTDYSTQLAVDFHLRVSTLTPWYLNLSPGGAPSVSSLWLFAGRSAAYIRARNSLL